MLFCKKVKSPFKGDKVSDLWAHAEILSMAEIDTNDWEGTETLVAEHESLFLADVIDSNPFDQSRGGDS